MVHQVWLMCSNYRWDAILRSIVNVICRSYLITKSERVVQFTISNQMNNSGCTVVVKLAVKVKVPTTYKALNIY